MKREFNNTKDWERMTEDQLNGLKLLVSEEIKLITPPRDARLLEMYSGVFYLARLGLWVERNRETIDNALSLADWEVPAPPHPLRVAESELKLIKSMKNQT